MCPLTICESSLESLPILCLFKISFYTVDKFYQLINIGYGCSLCVETSLLSDVWCEIPNGVVILISFSSSLLFTYISFWILILQPVTLTYWFIVYPGS